jgi:hypothetical protein
VVPSPQWRDAVDSADAALAAGRADAAVAASHRALENAWSTEEQVVSQRLLGEALLLAGEPVTAHAALRGALAFAVDLTPDHPAVARVKELLRAVAADSS